MSDQNPLQTNGNGYPPKDSTLAIISLIFGISAYVFLFIIGAIVAVVTGHLAKNQIKNSNGMIKGSSMANAGLILGYIQIAGTLLFIVILVIVLLSAGTVLPDIFENINGSFY